MTTATLDDAPVSATSSAAMNPAPLSTDALGEEIAALAARLHAATYELLVLLREFDTRTGWGNGFASCAHWLHWRTGIDLGAAREKVRVAHALAALPRISATMQRGAISYAKVRALTRVATPDNEAALLDFAQAGTAAQTERLVRAWRRVDDVAAAAQEESRHLHRHLSTWMDDDGMVVIRGRLTPEVGAVVQRALEAAADRLFREAQDSPRAEQLADEVTPAQRRADALGLLAEAALTADLDRGSAGDRYQVVLHMEAPTGVAAGEGLSGTMEVDHGAVNVSAETSRRISCDASVVRDASWRRRRGPRPGPQDPHDSAIDPAGAAGARPKLPIPGLHGPSLRRASRGALDRRRGDQPRQPRSPLSTPSSGGSRGWIRGGAAHGRDDDLPAARWIGARGGPGTASLLLAD